MDRTESEASVGKSKGDCAIDQGWKIAVRFNQGLVCTERKERINLANEARDGRKSSGDGDCSVHVVVSYSMSIKSK